MNQLNVQLLLTGNELMTGDIVDSNSVMIAQELTSLNLSINRKVTVADDINLLVNEINHISAQADILIINGGLGPTIDDLTAEALAKTVNLPLTSHPEAVTHIQQWCKKRNMPMNKPNLKQTILPKGCNIIANKNGSAVGFHVNYQGCDIYCTPGVPSELKTMLIDEIMPALAKNLPNDLSLDINRFQVFGLGESSVQKLVDDNIPDWPDSIALGFRASKPMLEVKLTTKSLQALQLKKHYINLLYDLLGDHIVGEIKTTPKSLAEYVVALLAERNLTVTTAESCTGGLIAHMLTQVSGASQVFEAGYVTYSNRIKNKTLSVSEATLIDHGAVSHETIIEMAQGALRQSSADIVIAVSGIAGPDGGSKNKPVGTVWIAWGNKENIQTQCLYLPSKRIHFQQYVASIGIDLIRRLLIKSNEIPKYITERASNKSDN